MHIVQSLHHNMKKNLLWIELDEGVRGEGLVDGLHNNQPTTFAALHMLHKDLVVVSSVFI